MLFSKSAFNTHRGRRGRESQCEAWVASLGWVLAWVASRSAASSCALRFSHFAIVLQFSWTKFFTKSEVLVFVLAHVSSLVP